MISLLQSVLLASMLASSPESANLCSYPELMARTQPVEISRDLRFRRLHLVRPDLIRYPIAVEVVC